MKGRITCKKLRDWVNEKFIELEITEYVCTRVERTHYSSKDIESGACRFMIFFDHADESKKRDDYNCFMCFYPIWELQKYIDMGYRLSLQWSTRTASMRFIRDLEIVPIR